MNPFDQMREQISAFPFAKLAEAQRTVAQAIAELPRRVGELGRALDIAEARAAQRENILMLEHGSNVPTDDEELVQLRADVAKAKEQLREVNVNQTKLRDLSKCLREELGQRGMALDSRVRQRCIQVWTPEAEAEIEDAIEALACALVAIAYRDGCSPEQANPVNFVTNIIGVQLQKRVKEKADRQRTEIRNEIIKENPTLGC